MIKLLFFKGLGAAAVGLIIVGSLIGRFGKERELRLELEARLKQTMPQGSLNAPPLSQMSERDPEAYKVADRRIDSSEAN
jgi:hypothetical protein